MEETQGMVGEASVFCAQILGTPGYSLFAFFKTPEGELREDFDAFCSKLFEAAFCEKPACPDHASKALFLSGFQKSHARQPFALGPFWLSGCSGFDPESALLREMPPIEARERLERAILQFGREAFAIFSWNGAPLESADGLSGANIRAHAVFEEHALASLFGAEPAPARAPRR